MNFINDLKESIEENLDKNAFCINETFYTYSDLWNKVSEVRSSIEKTIKPSEKLIGLIYEDSIETYASILALWFEGKAYVPANPATAVNRNIKAFDLAGVKSVIDLSNSEGYDKYLNIPVKLKTETAFDFSRHDGTTSEIAYILYTSGSTGEPKGVPISINNLSAFVEAIDLQSDFNIVCQDKCLQMFELTFDFSVVSFLLPLLKGACVFTIPKHVIKYFHIIKLLQTYKLTVLSFVPSIINYLKPYFEEISAPHVKYCSFGGGALYNDLVKDWSRCIPEATIFNYYGPTECTIYSSFYRFKSEDNIENNGVLAIGKPLNNTKYIIVDAENNLVKNGESGELCISSPQVTTGYWKNEEKNKKSFFHKLIDGEKLRFYKSGDLCFEEKTGNFQYIGRVDFQVKIRGFRIELSEVEFYAKKSFENKYNMIALDVMNNLNNAELALAVESDSEKVDSKAIVEYMKSRLPDYMVPNHIKFFDVFPLNVNGKFDRIALKKNFKLNK